MAAQLPPNVLKNIFQEIYGHRGNYRSDKNLDSLYSCLLVNKKWCENVVPILWSAVFYPIQTIRIGAITTYLSCLSSEKRKLLQDQAKINIPLQYDKPKFQYATYLTELNFDKFLKSIFMWSKKYRLPYRSTKRNELIIQYLLELFSSNCAKIKYLSMNSVPNYLLNDDYFENLNMINFKFLIEPNIRNCLSNVKELRLEWDALALDGFLSAVGYTCRSLEVLDANFAHDPELSNLFINKQQAEELSLLISSQSNLRKFILQDYRYFTHFFINSLYTQTHSLKEVEFYSVDFLGCVSFEVLEQCSLITHITFEDCENITTDMVKPLVNAPLPNLKSVRVYNNPGQTPCEDLILWADKKNFKRKWWENKITHQRIKNFISFIIIFWLFSPITVNILKILFKILLTNLIY